MIAIRPYGRRPVQPILRCLYCGAATESLIDEHAIPHGLGGHLILPKASCTACQKITSR